MTVAFQWLAEIAEGGATAFRIGTAGDELVAEWVGVARLFARRDGTSSRLEREPGADPREIAKIERGAAQLLLRHLSGLPALHGAAVALRGGAAILLGRSGQGKSTLAAALCARAGAELLADDAVSIDRASDAWLVSPREREHWLDAAARRALGHPVSEDEAEGKLPVAARSLRAKPAKLAALIELAFDDGQSDVRATKVSGIDAMACVVPQAVRFVLDDPALQKKELDVLADLVEHVPVYRLTRPHAIELLDAACEVVTDLIATDPVYGDDP